MSGLHLLFFLLNYLEEQQHNKVKDMTIYDYKIINEVIEYQKKVDKIYLGYLNLLQEKSYDLKQISEFEEIIKNKNSQ